MERWYAIHRYDGKTCAVSPAFDSKEAALDARSGGGSFLGVISSEWLVDRLARQAVEGRRLEAFGHASPEEHAAADLGLPSDTERSE